MVDLGIEFDPDNTSDCCSMGKELVYVVGNKHALANHKPGTEEPEELYGFIQYCPWCGKRLGGI